MKKYQELEAKIAELQQEVERLKEEEEKQKNSLPEDFDRNVVLEIINDPSSEYRLLYKAFTWDSTPEGHDYWLMRDKNKKVLTKDDIIQLQKWVILSYQQEIQ